VLLLEKLGYLPDPVKGYFHPDGRKFIQLGDIVDRGNKPVETLTLLMKMVKSGSALAILGNHDAKAWRYLKGNKVTLNHGLAETIKQIETQPPEFREEVRDFLATLPYELILDENRLSISHAGLPEHLQGVNSQKARTHALYGDVVNGVKDKNNFPIRRDWAKDYKGKRICVHGHVPVLDVKVCNNVWNIDLGCCFGNYLCALKYDSMEIVKVKALKTYTEFKLLGW